MDLGPLACRARPVFFVDAAASDIGAVWALAIFGVIIFFIGRAFRYVLAGR